MGEFRLKSHLSFPCNLVKWRTWPSLLFRFSRDSARQKEQNCGGKLKFLFSAGSIKLSAVSHRYTCSFTARETNFTSLTLAKLATVTIFPNLFHATLRRHTAKLLKYTSTVLQAKNCLCSSTMPIIISFHPIAFNLRTHNKLITNPSLNEVILANLASCILMLIKYICK